MAVSPHGAEPPRFKGKSPPARAEKGVIYPSRSARSRRQAQVAVYGLAVLGGGAEGPAAGGVQGQLVQRLVARGGQRLHGGRAVGVDVEEGAEGDGQVLVREVVGNLRVHLVQDGGIDPHRHMRRGRRGRRSRGRAWAPGRARERGRVPGQAWEAASGLVGPPVGPAGLASGVTPARRRRCRPRCRLCPAGRSPGAGAWCRRGPCGWRRAARRGGPASAAGRRGAWACATASSAWAGAAGPGQAARGSGAGRVMTLKTPSCASRGSRMALTRTARPSILGSSVFFCRRRRMVVFPGTDLPRPHAACPSLPG